MAYTRSSLKSEFFKTTKEWAKNVTTMDGLPNLDKTRRISRWLWIISLLISLGYMNYGVIVSLINYLSRDTVTKINFKREALLEFPTITFCNKNLINTNNGKFYLKNDIDQIKNITLINAYKYGQPIMEKYFLYIRESNKLKLISETIG